MGSPPRWRGKVQRVAGHLAAKGITPAWAGKRFPSFSPALHPEDHPRVGGEKLEKLVKGALLIGSPPRRRGKVYAVVGDLHPFGITPAWAGKRAFLTTSVSMKRGSPPRGRGKASSCGNGTCAPRITPAWAGKRLKRSHRSGIFISGPIPFHSVLHRPAGSGGSRAGRDGSPAGQPQNTGPA